MRASNKVRKETQIGVLRAGKHQSGRGHARSLRRRHCEALEIKRRKKGTI
uniref:Uncharacterized protein n=1 Tax=Siphoviridae sp. ct7iJ31 TaxID=2826167 RepID=A0A8S5NRG3_9CAUD|nr:MAG TPA: hypothetical protein [Siphoviridae sp. ct7iJ31]DAL19513.1 MAG TPA_asm: hypothetical protein [Caudoviricetes sp.]